jgi:hypothetical protein
MPLAGDLLTGAIRIVASLVEGALDALFARSEQWERRLLMAALFLLPLVIMLVFVFV